MEEQLRLEIRKEIEIYLENERKSDDKKRLAEIEKNVKVIPLILAIGSFISAALLSFSSSNSILYFLFFSPFYIVANIISYFILKSKSHPDIKRALLILPCFIHLLGVVLPIALLEFGFI